MNRTCTTIFVLFFSFGSQTFAQSVMDFDGINDQVAVPNASSFIANGPMSLSAWVYPTNPNPGWPDFDGILGFRNDISADFYLLQLSTTNLEARFRNSAGTNFDMVYNGLNLNSWNHFVFAYDNATLTLYHDGVSVMTMAASGSISSTTTELNLGFLPFGGNPFYFDGQLDDVGLWNTSLSATEVADLYASCSIDVSATNLVLAYEFDEGVAGGNNTGITSILDSKNNANGFLSGLALTGASSNFVADTKPLAANLFALTESSCGPYTSPSGTYVWTASGQYSDTIFASVGCDSIYTVDLTVANPSTASLSIAECDFYVSPAGNTYQISGAYSDTIPNAAGCDSVIDINLLLFYSSSALIQESACESYTSPSGANVWTSSGMYEDTISNAVGCDSILTIDLTIETASTAMIIATACDSYLSPSGTHVWTASGVYGDTLTNVAGCDSVMTIDLSIQTIDTSVTQVSNIELMSNLAGASYQWIDCANGEAISGETNQSFLAPANGSYAVIVSNGVCTDTSACVEIVSSGLLTPDNTLAFSLFPNPASEVLTLSFDEFLPSFDLQIINSLGQTVGSGHYVNLQTMELAVSNLADGLYILQLSDGEKSGSLKFLKR